MHGDCHTDTAASYGPNLKGVALQSLSYISAQVPDTSQALTYTLHIRDSFENLHACAGDWPGRSSGRYHPPSSCLLRF